VVRQVPADEVRGRHEVVVEKEEHVAPCGPGAGVPRRGCSPATAVDHPDGMRGDDRPAGAGRRIVDHDDLEGRFDVLRRQRREAAGERSGASDGGNDDRQARRAVVRAWLRRPRRLADRRRGALR